MVVGVEQESTICPFYTCVKKQGKRKKEMGSSIKDLEANPYSALELSQ